MKNDLAKPILSLKNKGAVHKFRPKGVFHVELYRKGKLIHKEAVQNGVTNAGLNDLLDVAFGGGTQKGTWYIGLIDNSGFTALDAADLASELTLTANPPTTTSWQELDDYNESVRQTWDDAAAASQSKTSSTVATFTINASVTIKGIFLVSSSTKGGTTGVLWSTGAFGSPVSAVSTDELRITYTLSTAEA